MGDDGVILQIWAGKRRFIVGTNTTLSGNIGISQSVHQEGMYLCVNCVRGIFNKNDNRKASQFHCVSSHCTHIHFHSSLLHYLMFDWFPK